MNLKELPAEISQLTNLIDIYIVSRNKLKELPKLSSNVQVYGIDQSNKNKCYYFR